MPNEIIGSGEITIKNILKTFYPKATIYSQVPLFRLVRQQYISSLNERQKKETLDIVVELEGQTPIVVRVQDRHHLTGRISSLDKVQERELTLSGLKVVDIWYYDAPQTFKDKQNKISEAEIKKIFKLSGIKI